jgi:hypothetical protein
MTDPNLSVIKSEAGAVARPMPNPAEMMQAMIDKGITHDNVAAFAELVKLSEHIEDRKAERDYATAKAALQAEMPKIQATRPVPNKDGTLRYKFAPFEDIMRQVQPCLERYGFTVSFSTRYEEARLVKICTLQHISGHSKSNEFAVRIGNGPPGATDTQADGAAGTYAKRFALCDALNIVIEHDSDAKAEGGKIDLAQMKELQCRVKSLRVNEAQFLAYAKAKAYTEIVSTAYDRLDEFLTRKETEARASLKKRVLAAGGNPQDLAASSGAASFDELPATALEGVAEIVRKMEGK